MTKDLLIKHLQSIVEAEQKRFNKRFAPQAMDEMSEIIISGVNRMTPVQRNRKTYINAAEYNLKDIIYACYNRSSMRDEAEISRETFIAVRMQDCPKWPYC